MNKRSHIAVSRIFQLVNLSYLVQVAEWRGFSFMNGKKSYSRGSSQQGHNSNFRCYKNSPLGLPSQAGNTIENRQKSLKIYHLEIYYFDRIQVKIVSVCGILCYLALGRISNFKLWSHLLQPSQVSTILDCWIRAM